MHILPLNTCDAPTNLFLDFIPGTPTWALSISQKKVHRHSPKNSIPQISFPLSTRLQAEDSPPPPPLGETPWPGGFMSQWGNRDPTITAFSPPKNSNCWSWWPTLQSPDSFEKLWKPSGKSICSLLWVGKDLHSAVKASNIWKMTHYWVTRINCPCFFENLEKVATWKFNNHPTHRFEKSFQPWD